MAQDDQHEATQAVAGFFSLSRKLQKERTKDAPKSVPMHHRANTDWWNCIPGGKKRR